jgi:murein DD-endopeptidase MepM/ murein hydrolase activator NlpD
MAVHAAMAAKKLLKGLFLIFGVALVWIGRHLILPIIVRLYQLIVRIRRAFRPAERRFRLIATHRGILHGAVIAVALTTAGGNLYAQTQATVSSGEQSVLYKYVTGDDSTVVESGPPSANDPQDIADVNNAASDNDPADDTTDDTLDQGSDAMTELGALMPETVPGSGTVVHRTQIEQYTVQSGDTLSDIADKFDISIATILWENKLTVHDFIQPGQTLSILPTTGITYKVQAGDTIAKIAAANGVDPQDIESWNNITDETALALGQSLIIPGGKIATPLAPKPRFRILASPIQVFTKPPDAVDNNITDMVWPTTSHIITQPYGIWSRIDHGIHTGVDLGAPYGAPIYAADDGIVTHSGCGSSCSTGYGYYIDIDHGNGIMTRYGHTSKRFVVVGQQVHRGEVIALIGSTGHSTGPHLHFEVRVNGRHVNPMPYIE